jgi:hypothetical protein
MVSPTLLNTNSNASRRSRRTIHRTNAHNATLSNNVATGLKREINIERKIRVFLA